MSFRVTREFKNLLNGKNYTEILKTSRFACMLLREQGLSPELRKKAINVVVKSPSYAYNFLLDSNYNAEEFQLAYDAILQSPRYSYMYLKYKNPVNGREKLIESITKNSQYSALSIIFCQLNSNEKNICFGKTLKDPQQAYKILCIANLTKDERGKILDSILNNRIVLNTLINDRNEKMVKFRINMDDDEKYKIVKKIYDGQDFFNAKSIKYLLDDNLITLNENSLELLNSIIIASKLIN